ncbi:MAG: tetratricopeptide repeat protein, partial [Ignavibacteriales bacterium]|nr:tetratricopeptide repeat protein [Ignavibacteriales bacterium]
ATDPSLKTAYVDTMLHLYDLGIKHVADRAGALWLQKAYALENYYPDKEQEAIAAYEKTLEIDFDGTDFAYIDRLGALYIKNIPNDASSKMKAVELYRRVAEKDPTNQTVVDRLRRLITDPRELIELAEKKLATDPENMEYLWSTAQAYIQAEQFDGAERYLNKLVKKAPTTVNYWNELGKVYFRDRKFRPSIDAYESALKLNPAVKENYLNIAWCHRELKNFESARTYAQRAAQRERGWGRPYMEIAEIYKSAVEDCIMNSKEGDWAKMDLNDKLVYKLAHESYQRAKSVEPGIAGEADQRARELSTLVPTREDYFFHRDKIKDGKLDIQGSCYTWIKETATVPR